MMKGNSLNSRKKAQKTFPTHEEKKRDSKNEKYFNFSKMDKKNVQN